MTDADGLAVFVAIVERRQHGDAIGRVLVRLGLVVVGERHFVRVVNECHSVASHLTASGSSGRHCCLVPLLVRVLVEQKDLLALGCLTTGVG